MGPCVKSFSYTLDSVTNKGIWTNLSRKHNVTSVGGSRALCTLNMYKFFLLSFLHPFPSILNSGRNFFLLIHFPGADQKKAGGSLEGASHERDERGVGAIAKIPPSGSPGKRCKEKRACVQNQREQGLISSCSVGT